jgi:hypothetical protein
MKTVIAGLILAFLLFTPQGQFIAMSAIGPALMAAFPPPAQETVAAKTAAHARWEAEQEAEKKCNEEAAREERAGDKYAYLKPCPSQSP